MSQSLARWIADADAMRHIELFEVPQQTLDFTNILGRFDDYYLALVGDLFQRMKDSSPDGPAWARVGNAIAQFAAEGQEATLKEAGVAKTEAILLAAAAFYCGGFPASAYLTAASVKPLDDIPEAYLACYDLMARPRPIRSQFCKRLLSALRMGDMNTLALMRSEATQRAAAALDTGPHEWLPERLFDRLVDRFVATNIRAVLPDGGAAFWSPFVASMLDRKPPSWEFFPSQIDAIERGLLERTDTFALQMPTGAGKTALCETLLYWHAKRTTSEVAILLVPYRSLASELRWSVVKRLNAMSISARCAYGGTVPSGDEVRALDDTRVVVATPESLSGLLGADEAFFKRVSLVICDEGHLLDGGARGIGLELLLARMRCRDGGAPRFVFVSAIVPNIEEINAWLGGSADTVVRSDYRPALAEFSVLRGKGAGRSLSISLEMHPHETPPTRFGIEGFLERADFQWWNKTTGRHNTYSYTSMKTRAIAAARKALVMGGAVVFAANKRGEQGAIGLAKELVKQLSHKLRLPSPITFANVPRVSSCVEYLGHEFGSSWIGTRALAVGAVLHHGDVPQEAREVVELLLRSGDVRLAICTNTLAEGVNLPIRTLVLYSVQRGNKDGRPENLLARDIKNLVGRAGRAGATTKGLVVCANEHQWPIVEQVARQAPGEPVHGALRALIEGLRNQLALQNAILTNQMLEGSPALHTLVDGVDATLIDLAVQEIGEDALVALAVNLADQTFASQQGDPGAKLLLQNVFELRARRVVGIKAAGRLDWVRTTGARARILDAVEVGLLPRRATWDDLLDPLDSELVAHVLAWAWDQMDIQAAVRESYRLGDNVETEAVRQSFIDMVNAWLAGDRFNEIALKANLPMDTFLGVHGRVVAFTLQTLVEQGVALLSKFLEALGQTLAPAAALFPEHLRFGLPTSTALVLASGGVRHRVAAVQLGSVLGGKTDGSRLAVFSAARRSLLAHRTAWEALLGTLVVENTLVDLSGGIGDADVIDQ